MESYDLFQLLIGLFLFNILLVTSYCFFNMSIILVVGYYCGSSCTNRIEFSLIYIGFITLPYNNL